MPAPCHIQALSSQLTAHTTWQFNTMPDQTKQLTDNLGPDYSYWSQTHPAPEPPLPPKSIGDHFAVKTSGRRRTPLQQRGFIGIRRSADRLWDWQPESIQHPLHTTKCSFGSGAATRANLTPATCDEMQSNCGACNLDQSNSHSANWQCIDADACGLLLRKKLGELLCGCVGGFPLLVRLPPTSQHS